MRRLLVFLMAMFTAHECVAATLTGKAQHLWTEKPISDVIVTVNSVTGMQLAVTKTDANGAYEIKGLPKKRIEIRYQRDGWQDDPAIYPPIALSDGANHHVGELCNEELDSHGAKQIAVALYKAVHSSTGAEAQLAVLDRISPKAKALITDSYATESLRAASESSLMHAEIEKQLLRQMELAYARRSLRRNELRRKALIEDLSDMGAIRSRRDGDIVLTVHDSYFAPGKFTVTPKVGKQYQELVPYFSALGVHSITVEGHADSTGSEFLNASLADRRAELVRSLLIASGVPAARVEAVGKGEASPSLIKAGDATQYDRRVDLVLVLDEKHSSSW
jgi:outer membrane protein OmpA-like peptidoglycan-associated protein